MAKKKKYKDTEKRVKNMKESVRGLIGRIEEAKRQPKDEASDSFVFLGAVQHNLEKALDGWTFSTEGHRGGEMKGAPKGEDEQDDFTLNGHDADKMKGAKIMVSSVNDREEHQALFYVYGAKADGGMVINRKYEKVGKGDARKVAADILAALKKAGTSVKESAPRTVSDMLDEEKDPADVAAGMIEKPDALLRLLKKDMERLEKGLSLAQSALKGYRKAGTGSTVAVDLLKEYLVTPIKHLADTANLALGDVMKAIK
jgi:polyhydroxyalkanoate synthesis regulator phasin